MSTVVRYRVRPEAVEENTELVRAVYAQLHERRPPGLRYETHRLADGWFVHVADGGNEGLVDLPAFSAFQAGLGARCEVPPDVAPAELIGRYEILP
jgi:sirohydrochlorin ferrochelatase